MKRSLKVIRTRLLPLGVAMGVATLAKADFTPIALNTNSFNYDVVVEATSPRALNDVVNATMDGGTNKNGNTFYERGYNGNAPTTGLPPAGSLVTNFSGDHVFVMPPNYHTNNVIMVGKNNGGRTPIIPQGTLTLTPAVSGFTALSFLTASGNGPVTVGYTLHFADNSTQVGTFVALDWFNSTNNVA